ncbi:galactose oxidase-like protein [Actinomycetospora succinea]|uniref:Galactose oxidase-like protein n=1 Tax=Actinomycetospora succinea TaxID=663603 RepID=A0A4R6VPW7_9PSEU|nr:glyoxal oxidase [Actinomycetospora succinea]TDQ65989.1 galactose oxidase-like protein [Actinomycetospora succinea]
MPDDPAQHGRWDPVIGLPDVAIHLAVLPTGKVLAWGRRRDPQGSMHQQGCAPFVWDPATGTSTPTDEPARADGTPVNLFCSGHALLADGRLLVAGGHVTDGDGLDQACVYDAGQDTWTPLPPLRSGRWYPGAVTLADGRVLVISGSHQDGPDQPVEPIPEIWDGATWQPTRDFQGLPLYPRVHQLPDGRVGMVGSNGETTALDTAGAGTWSTLGTRAQGERQYGPAVMDAPGRVVYLGGGNDAGDHRPTDRCEKIDLTTPTPAWTPAATMAFRRRQHNATLLPDGTVLVTSGTSGPDFNDLAPGAPVHAAELWDPATDTWTTLASEDVDRCYHASAVLLPDATVLSAGGGEFVVGATPNAPQDTHRDAQVFRPPYLFRGPRPAVAAAPDVITPGETFTVTTDDPGIAAVTLVRLSSATHTLNTDQRFVRLAATPDTADPRTLAVTAPASSADWPPGPAILFVLAADGTPSPAHLLRVATGAPPPAPPPAAPERATRRRRRATGTAVTVGLTAQCPYGLGPCWGGAYTALGHLEGVGDVDPVPDHADQTARVVLTHRGLPDLASWPGQLAARANASYVLRGVEVTLRGSLGGDPGDPHLTSPDLAEPLRLHRIAPGHHVPWDLRRRRRRSLTADERDAHRRLLAVRADRPGTTVTVTGPLRLVRGRAVLSVRTVTEDH